MPSQPSIEAAGNPCFARVVKKVLPMSDRRANLDELHRLTEIFRQLGADYPESWARSQLEVHQPTPASCGKHFNTASRNEMSPPAFNIRHGTLLNVTGRPVRWERITFLPADVSLSGDDAQYGHPLKDCLSSSNPQVRAMVAPHQDAPWALGRILFLFGSHLLSDINEFRSEVCLYVQAFMAVLHDLDNLTIPFVCGDYFCESSLMFSSDESLSANTKNLIAKAFWSLLLSSPMEIEDYESCMLHAKIGNGRIRFGVSGGQPFIVDTNE